MSWLRLDIDLPKLRKFSQILIMREPLVATGWKLGISCLQINLFVGLLVEFPVAMVVRDAMVDFTVGQFTTMPHLGLSGLRIRYLLGPVRPSWVKNVLSSGYTTPLALRRNTFMVIMVSFHWRSTAWSVPRRSSCNHSWVWERSIRILKLSGLYKLSCIWLALFWCIQVYTGWTWGLMTSPFGFFAVKHVVWLYNRVPNFESGLTSMELLTKQKADHSDILRSHVWGCLLYVLKPKLQNGQKLPKWNRWSRLGQFLGYSDEHSSLVTNIWHLKTGFVSPQYHVVFDDLFKTVFSSGTNNALGDSICENLYGTSCEISATDEYDAHDNLVFKPPPLDEVWLDAEGREQSKIELRKQCKRNEDLMRNHEVTTKDMAPTPATQGGHVPDILLPDGALISDDDDSFISNTESEGGFGGANADDNGSEGAIPNQGAQGPNFAVDGKGGRRSTRRRDPIQRLVPGANNI